MSQCQAAQFVLEVEMAIYESYSAFTCAFLIRRARKIMGNGHAVTGVASHTQPGFYGVNARPPCFPLWLWLAHRHNISSTGVNRVFFFGLKHNPILAGDGTEDDKRRPVLNK
jgi:hypothetical protein